jgi:hypothetical protein
MSLSALLLMAQIATPPLVLQPVIYREMTVIDILPDPAPSGILHTYQSIIGRSKTGETVIFERTFLAKDLLTPLLGSVCTFTGYPGAGSDIDKSTVRIDSFGFDCNFASPSREITATQTGVQPRD